MVTLEEDIREMRVLFDAALATFPGAKRPPFGAMIETPAAALRVVDGDRPPRGLPLRRHERPRAVHARCGAGRSRREPLLRRHPCRRAAAADDRHQRRGGRADRAVWRAGRARGDDAGTSPARLPFAQHGPGVDPGREGADPRRTPRRPASEAPRGARSGALATPGFSAAVAETGSTQYAPRLARHRGA